MLNDVKIRSMAHLSNLIEAIVLDLWLHCVVV